MNEDDTNNKDINHEFFNISEEEKQFYDKMYPSIEMVTKRKIHCTACNTHIGTAPSQANIIRMHPILRVTLCKKCYEFYNSGEFSKGNDGSELYCRWCGQGGEVYCCSNCPFVFCRTCILVNLSENAVADIEENENWHCFSCAPKILFHLRAQHWALLNFIEKQKKSISSKQYNDLEIRRMMTKDSTSCCVHLSRNRSLRNSGNTSDFSNDSSTSSTKNKSVRKRRSRVFQLESSDSETSDDITQSKKQKSNNEVVCTPDVLTMLSNPSTRKKNSSVNETHDKKEQQAVQSQQKPKIIQMPMNKKCQQVTHTQAPLKIALSNSKSQSLSMNSRQQQLPPLIVRDASELLQPLTQGSTVRKTIAPRPSCLSTQTPVYHTINGYRIDLNSAAQQQAFRLPNGKLIQVKKQTPQSTVTCNTTMQNNSTKQVISRNTSSIPNILNQALQSQTSSGTARFTNPALTLCQDNRPVQHFSIQGSPLQAVRYAPATQIITGNTGRISNSSGTIIFGNPPTGIPQTATRPVPSSTPLLTRQIFPPTPIGQARTELQRHIISAIDIFKYLSGKIHTLTNSNAYKEVEDFTHVRDLYIHLSYLFQYAIGRFKSLYDDCLDEMKKIGFSEEAANLIGGQHLSSDKRFVNDDDIEIVEPNTTCIDLDSDNEDNKTATSAEVSVEKVTETVNNEPCQELSSEALPSKSSKYPLTTSPVISSDNSLIENSDVLTEVLRIESYEPLQSTSNSSETSFNITKPCMKTTNRLSPKKQVEIQQCVKIQELVQLDKKLGYPCSVVLDKVDVNKFEVAVSEKSKNDNFTEKDGQKENENGKVEKDNHLNSKNSVDVNATNSNEVSSEKSAHVKEIHKQNEKTYSDENNCNKTVPKVLKITNDKNDKSDSENSKESSNDKENEISKYEVMETSEVELKENLEESKNIDESDVFRHKQPSNEDKEKKSYDKKQVVSLQNAVEELNTTQGLLNEPLSSDSETSSQPKLNLEESENVEDFGSSRKVNSLNKDKEKKSYDKKQLVSPQNAVEEFNTTQDLLNEPLSSDSETSSQPKLNLEESENVEDFGSSRKVNSLNKDKDIKSYDKKQLVSPQNAVEELNITKDLLNEPLSSDLGTTSSQSKLNLEELENVEDFGTSERVNSLNENEKMDICVDKNVLNSLDPNSSVDDSSRIQDISNELLSSQSKSSMEDLDNIGNFDLSEKLNAFDEDDEMKSCNEEQLASLQKTIIEVDTTQDCSIDTASSALEISKNDLVEEVDLLGTTNCSS